MTHGIDELRFSLDTVTSCGLGGFTLYVDAPWRGFGKQRVVEVTTVYGWRGEVRFCVQWHVWASFGTPHEEASNAVYSYVSEQVDNKELTDDEVVRVLKNAAKLYKSVIRMMGEANGE